MNYQVRRPSLEALFREVDNFSPKKEYLQTGKTDFPV